MSPNDPALQVLIDRIHSARSAGAQLCIRGGGSKDFYGEAPQGEVLDTRILEGTSSYEPTELVVTTRCGTSLAALEALLATKGQCLPFEPPHFGDSELSAATRGATVGGMVAAGLSGPSRAATGSVRDYVLGATILNGNGEVLSFGGQVMKNVAGYDVSRLMAGALGTLGLIAEVSLKVLPMAPAEATLVFALPQAEALRRLNAWGGQPLPLNASRWEQRDGTPTLHLRLRGAVAAVEAACRSLGGERLDGAQAAAPWQACREQQLPWFDSAAGHSLWRLSVPQTAVELDLGAPPLIEWHGAQRWVHAPAGDAERLRRIAKDAGGHATLFRAAPDSAAGVARFQPLAAPLDRIHANLKREFDPAGIFNPGRLLPNF